MEREYAQHETVKRLEQNVPAQLKILPQWVLWKYEGQPGRNPRNHHLRRTAAPRAYQIRRPGQPSKTP